MANVLEDHGYSVMGSDIVDRGYKDTKICDFFSVKENHFDIITNPPYSLGLEFIKHALEISDVGVKIAFFLKLTFLESEKRKQFFEKYPPQTVYVFSSRVKCAMNGDFDKYPTSAVAYAWFIWEKGFYHTPVIKWI